MAEISGHVIFCEDIREESGGKTSFMGVLGSSMLVDRLPAIAQRLNASVILRVCGEESVTATISIALEGADAPVPPPVRGVYPRKDTAGGDEWTLMLHMALSGVPLVDGMVLQLTCDVEGGPAVVGRLAVQAQDQ